jgi:hypothetical protein
MYQEEARIFLPHPHSSIAVDSRLIDICFGASDFIISFLQEDDNLNDGAIALTL